MRAAVGLAAIGLLSSVPHAALADWEYTKWGMQPAEVINASRGSAVAYADRDHDWDVFRAEASASYIWHGFAFTAYFLFHRDSKALNYVSLSLRAPEKCPDLDAKLRQVYGKPAIDVKKPAFNMGSWLHAPDNADFTLTFTKLDPPSCDLRFTRPAKLP
jgi:hypothetical protein